jgi:hypothetical protein
MPRGTDFDAESASEPLMPSNSFWLSEASINSADQTPNIATRSRLDRFRELLDETANHIGV